MIEGLNDGLASHGIIGLFSITENTRPLILQSFNLGDGADQGLNRSILQSVNPPMAWHFSLSFRETRRLYVG